MEKYALQKVEIRNTIPLDEAKKEYTKITKRKPRKIRESKNFYQFRFQPPTKFEKKSFRTKVVNDDIRLIYGKLKEDHHHLEGAGLFDYFKKGYDYAKNAVSEALSINDYSDKAKNMISLYGNYPVVALQIRRHPIQADKVFQLVSLGKWGELKKKYGYDQLFHLMLVATIEKPDSGAKRQVKIEQVGVVSINDNIDPMPGEDTFDVDMKGKAGTFTLGQMLEDTKNRIGKVKFFEYSAFTESGSNCQGFVTNLLQTEGLWDEKVKAFVYQDVTGIYKDFKSGSRSYVPAIANTVTKAIALGSKYFNIGGNRETLNSLIGGMNPTHPWEKEAPRFTLSENKWSKKYLEGGMRDRKTELLIGDYVDFLGRRGLTPQESRDIANMYVRQLLDTNDRKKLRVIRKHIQNDMYSQRESGLDPIPEIEGYGNPKHDEDLRANKKGGMQFIRNDQEETLLSDRIRAMLMLRGPYRPRLNDERQALYQFYINNPIHSSSSASRDLFRQYMNLLISLQTDIPIPVRQIDEDSNVQLQRQHNRMRGIEEKKYHLTEEEKRKKEKQIEEEERKKEAPRGQQELKVDKNAEGEGEGCPICLDAFGDKPTSTCCSSHHLAHTLCVNPLLNEPNPKCPRCRRPLVLTRAEREGKYIYGRGNEGSAKPDTEQFLEYVKEHHHDLEAPHTLEQMYMDWKEMKGGNKASGFIAAMMARKSEKQSVKDHFKAQVEKKSKALKGRLRKKAYTTEEVNKFKFGALDNRGFDLSKLSKTTKDVARRTIEDDVKSFHEYVLKNAPQHKPLSGKNPIRNYRKTYDLKDMYEQWENQEKPEPKPEPKEVKEKKESKEERKARKAEKEKRKAEKEKRKAEKAEKEALKAEKEKKKAEKEKKKEKDEKKEKEEPVVDYNVVHKDPKYGTTYRCGSCGQTFLGDTALRAHNNARHKGITKKIVKINEEDELPDESNEDYEYINDKGQKAFTCGTCYEQFIQKSSLDTHNKSKHPDIIKEINKTY